MKNSNRTRLLAIAGIIGMAATTAHAVPIPYAAIGTPNTVTYTFTATSTGPITAYFVGESAGYGSVIGMSVNGSTPAFSAFGLQNHTGSGGTASTPYGTSFVLGNVTAGDILRFILAVDAVSPNYNGPATPADVTYYLNSDASLNPGGENHVYSSPYGGDALIPAGTYVGFEDISPLANGDIDYNDHQFVFAGVTSSVPEGGSTMAIMGLATLAIGVLRRRMK